MNTDWEKEKNNLKATYLEGLKKPYEQEINEADDTDDKKYSHDCYKNKLKEQKLLRYTEAELTTTVRLNVWEIMNKITALQKKKIYKHDYNAAFELCRGSLTDQEKKEVINILAKYEAYTEFDTFIKEQDEIYCPVVNEPLIHKEQKDKLSHKQQILLLNHLGMLDNVNIKNLSTEKKGLLLGNLLNRHEKNTSDYLRYFDGKNNGKYNCKTPANIDAVNKVLKVLGLGEIP